MPGEDDAFCGHVLSGDDDGTGVDDGSQMDLDDFGWIIWIYMIIWIVGHFLGTKVAACGDSALRDAANATVHVVQARSRNGRLESSHFSQRLSAARSSMATPC